MKEFTKKRFDMVKEFLELLDKHDVAPSIEVSGYTTHSMGVINEAEKIFNGRLEEDVKRSEQSTWIVLKESNSDYLCFTLFYPSDNKQKKGGE